MQTISDLLDFKSKKSQVLDILVENSGNCKCKKSREHQFVDLCTSIWLLKLKRWSQMPFLKTILDSFYASSIVQ